MSTPAGRLRIIAGAWKGRRLAVPAGWQTRPTAERVRQAIFDMLIHAPWGGRIDGWSVLDAFAGTGALGLEALSRGAAEAVFIEQDRAVLGVLRANVAAVGAAATVLACDAMAPPRGKPVRLAFLDPPYGRGLVPLAVAALARSGWLDATTLLIVETGAADMAPVIGDVLAERRHGVTRIMVMRLKGLETVAIASQ